MTCKNGRPLRICDLEVDPELGLVHIHGRGAYKRDKRVYVHRFGMLTRDARLSIVGARTRSAFSPLKAVNVRAELAVLLSLLHLCVQSRKLGGIICSNNDARTIFQDLRFKALLRN